MTDENIKKILDAYFGWREIEGFSKIITIEEARRNDYNLSISWNEVPYCRIEQLKFRKYQLKDEDILFARIEATTGKTCFVENPPTSVYASYLIRFVAKSGVHKNLFTIIPKHQYIGTK